MSQALKERGLGISFLFKFLVHDPGKPSDHLENDNSPFKTSINRYQLTPGLFHFSFFFFFVV